MSRRRGSRSPQSVDLAGRAIGLSPAIPTHFDAPLGPHHRLIGRWLAGSTPASEPMSLAEARAFIEHGFTRRVLETLAGCDLIDLRVVALAGEHDLPPAIITIVDSIGQIDLKWIEQANVLSNTLFGSIAPVGWRAAAYRALAEALGGPLPVFGYGELFEEISMYYWDGATDDDDARRTLREWHGVEPEDLDGFALPSEMNARRPDWMLGENAAPLRRLPRGLAQRIRRLRSARDALESQAAGSAWRFEFDRVLDYVPGYEDVATLPPLTLVSADHFARELDELAQHGMETGFMDVAGLCQLTAPATVDAWFTSFAAGVELLAAAQHLIDFDPASAEHRA